MRSQLMAPSLLRGTRGTIHSMPPRIQRAVHSFRAWFTYYVNLLVGPLVPVSACVLSFLWVFCGVFNSSHPHPEPSPSLTFTLTLTLTFTPTLTLTCTLTLTPTFQPSP